jgi:flagellar motor switch protein FliN/FliY
MSESALNDAATRKAEMSGPPSQETAPPSRPREAERSLKPFLGVPFDVSIELGRIELKIRDLLRLGPHSILELDKPAGGSLDICVNGMLVGRGEPVILEERVQIKVNEIVESHG